MRCLLVVTVKKKLNEQALDSLVQTMQGIQKICPEIAKVLLVDDSIDIQLLPLDGTKLEPNPELQQNLMDKVVRLIDLQ